jgi:hypothetical protein
MVLADIRLLQVMWGALFLLILAMFVWLFVRAVRYLLHDELSRWAKAGVLVGLIIFPLIGPLAYLLVRGAWITDESAADAALRARRTRGEFERHRGDDVAESTGARTARRPARANGAAEERHDR